MNYKIFSRLAANDIIGAAVNGDRIESLREAETYYSMMLDAYEVECGGRKNGSVCFNVKTYNYAGDEVEFNIFLSDETAEKMFADEALFKMWCKFESITSAEQYLEEVMKPHYEEMEDDFLNQLFGVVEGPTIELAERLFTYMVEDGKQSLEYWLKEDARVLRAENAGQFLV